MPFPYQGLRSLNHKCLSFVLMTWNQIYITVLKTIANDYINLVSTFVYIPSNYLTTATSNSLTMWQVSLLIYRGCSSHSRFLIYIYILVCFCFKFFNNINETYKICDKLLISLTWNAIKILNETHFLKLRNSFNFDFNHWY